MVDPPPPPELEKLGKLTKLPMDMSAGDKEITGGEAELVTVAVVVDAVGVDARSCVKDGVDWTGGWLSA